MIPKVWLFISLGLIGTSAEASPQVRWYAVNLSLNEAGNSLNLGEASQKIDLNGGWSCTVSPTSKQLPSYEARQVMCQSGDKKFEFSIQCESTRVKDRTQIRFKDVLVKDSNFIEVGCELIE